MVCGADFLEILDVVGVMVVNAMEVVMDAMLMAGSQKISARISVEVGVMVVVVSQADDCCW